MQFHFLISEFIVRQLLMTFTEKQNVMLEMLMEVVVLTIFAPIGAFYLWTINAFRKPYGYYVKWDGYFLGTFGIVVSAVLFFMPYHYILSYK